MGIIFIDGAISFNSESFSLIGRIVVVFESIVKPRNFIECASSNTDFSLLIVKPNSDNKFVVSLRFFEQCSAVSVSFSSKA